MNLPVAQKGHPKGLYVLFATEMWERFNYYGMRAILVLFMTKALMFDKVFASNLYGSYTGLVYLTPLIGGYMADRYWGSQRSIIAGGLVMALGELVLFFCSMFYHSAPDLSTLLFFTGLGLMISGNGFFKPNISSMVGQLYPKGDRRLDAAYTIFYMGINVGGAFGPFLCGLFGDTGNPADFKWGFLTGCVAMLLSVVVQLLFHHKYVKDPEGKTLGLTPQDSPSIATKPLTILGGLLFFSFLTIGLIYIDAKVFNYLFYLLIGSVTFIATVLFSDKSLSPIEKSKVAVIFILSFFVIFFWSAYEQAGASLTFFADEQTNRSMIWLTGMYALHTCGELCLSPIGLSLVNKLAPTKFASLLMAVWFTANAFANKFAGVLSSLYPDNKTTNFLGIYEMSNLYSFFMLFVFMAGIASLILFLLTKKLQKMMH